MEVDVLEDNRKRVLSEIDRREIEEYIKLHLNKKKKYKLLKIICGLVVCGLIFFSGIFLSKGILGEKVDGLRDGVVTMQTVKKVLYPASDLVSGRYYYKNAVSEIEYIRKSLIEHDQPDRSRYELDYLCKKH